MEELEALRQSYVEIVVGAAYLLAVGEITRSAYDNIMDDIRPGVEMLVSAIREARRAADNAAAAAAKIYR